MRQAALASFEDSALLQSPIRWAGSKRLLLSRLLGLVPRRYRTYYEPMVGSGALFFSLLPARAILGDVNPDLVNFYRVVKRQPHTLHTAVNALSADRTTYYKLRGWEPATAVQRAARFYYLIRLSWNGIYRVNREGQFNVPFGGRSPRELLPLAKVLGASRALGTATLALGDFEESTKSATAGDFVFFDPPYPKGSAAGNGFARYTPDGFALDDHMRLADYAAKLASRGVHVMVTEAARRTILAMYPRTFFTTLIRNPSLIAARSKHRRHAYEVILTSYPPARPGSRAGANQR